VGDAIPISDRAKEKLIQQAASLVVPLGCT
jgi:hypothetical protein